MISEKFNSFLDWADTTFCRSKYKIQRQFAELANHNSELKERMKPKADDAIGYFVEDTQGDFRVIAVNMEKFLENVERAKNFDQLDKNRLYFARRAFADNNKMMPMIRLKAREDGTIGLDDGNHRLEALSTRGEKSILVYVRESDVPKGKTLDDVEALIKQACGADGTEVSEVDGKYVYCDIEYDQVGPSKVPFRYDERYEGGYFKVGNP